MEETTERIIKKCGNSIIVRLDPEFCKVHGLELGDIVEIKPKKKLDKNSFTGEKLKKSLENLKSLMVGGKIKLEKNMGPDLKKVVTDSKGNIVESSVSDKVKNVLLVLEELK